MTVLLLGASGYTGALVARSLDRLELGFVAGGRDRERTGAAVAGLSACEGVVEVDVTDRAGLARACEDRDVVVTTVGPFEQLGRPVLDAAIAHGAHYVDSSGEQTFLRWAFSDAGPRAEAAGVTAIPAAGFDFVPGDALAAVAAAELEAPREVHVSYLARGPGVIASRGTRRTTAQMVGRPISAYVAGRLVEEQVGEVRRAAWFPRPVGPRQAASIPGGEALTVPTHVDGVQLVRTYLALPGALIDAAQLLGGLVRWPPVRRVLTTVLELGPEGPSERVRQRTRWACLAEAEAASGTVARAWVYGQDLYGFTATAMAAVTRRLVRGEAAAAGVVAPARAFAAAGLLDELSDLSGIRWSVRTGPGRS